jgi:glycerophosphoryl diester phosphodiesterase
MSYSPLASVAGFIHVCAHRGHSVAAPENTLPAFEAAVTLGATVLEIDVVLTRDDEIVLMHDEILDRTTNGKGRVSDHVLAAIKQLDAGAWFDPKFGGTMVPTLAEVIDFARAKEVGLLIEIKERLRSGLIRERLGQRLTEMRAENEVLVISFDHVSLVRLREAFPALRTELITHARHLDLAVLAKQADAASVSIEWNMFHPDDARALHEAGIGVRVSLPRPERLAARSAYGFDDEARVVEHLSAGLIDVLLNDDVAIARKLVDAAKVV